MHFTMRFRHETLDKKIQKGFSTAVYAIMRRELSDGHVQVSRVSEYSFEAYGGSSEGLVVTPPSRRIDVYHPQLYDSAARLASLFARLSQKPFEIKKHY